MTEDGNPTHSAKESNTDFAELQNVVHYCVGQYDLSPKFLELETKEAAQEICVEEPEITRMRNEGHLYTEAVRAYNLANYVSNNSEVQKVNDKKDYAKQSSAKIAEKRKNGDNFWLSSTSSCSSTSFPQKMRKNSCDMEETDNYSWNVVLQECTEKPATSTITNSFRSSACNNVGKVSSSEVPKKPFTVMDDLVMSDSDEDEEKKVVPPIVVKPRRKFGKWKNNLVRRMWAKKKKLAEMNGKL